MILLLRGIADIVAAVLLMGSPQPAAIAEVEKPVIVENEIVIIEDETPIDDTIDFTTEGSLQLTDEENLLEIEITEEEAARIRGELKENVDKIQERNAEAQRIVEENIKRKQEEERKKKEEEERKKKEEEEKKKQKENQGSSKNPEFDYDIASYITKYSTSKANANRNHNMLLASNAIDGVILYPGDSFSYNQVILSKRDKNNDYKEAGVLVNGEPATGIGGGICQISSTLFEAALYSGMTITERHNHSAKVGYLPAGRDATVSWGGPDLKFKNNLGVPVMIESVMKDGTLKIRFLSKGTPSEFKEIKVDVAAKNGVYYLTRYIDGKKDYTTTSRYK